MGKTASIETKSTGTLIDELFTTNMKCWKAQDVVCTAEEFESIANAAVEAQKLNKRRNELIRAIDERLGEGEITLTSKTY